MNTLETIKERYNEVTYPVGSMAQQFYMHLSSADSKEYFPSNRASSFIVKLPENISLMESWCCALTELQYSYSKGSYDTFCVCSNICEDSIVGGIKLSILRSATTKGSGGRARRWTESWNDLYYIPLKQTEFNTIEINITDRKGEEVSFIDKDFICTLHFKTVYPVLL